MANASAAPIVVPTSESWDGNDGPWSTFSIHVGTPPQPARVLVSTALGEQWVISANKTQGGCLSTDASTCAQSRGGLINVNASSTWKDQGIFAVGLEINLPDYLGNYDNGDYGLDNFGVGLPGSGGVSLDNIVVSALATKDYYLGYIGVTDHPTNFTEFDDPHPSFLSTLKSTGKIPSLSYGYTAGAQYRFKKVDGSLTLGGYDASKFAPNNVNFLMASDISRDLVIGLQDITYSDSNVTNGKLLNQGILTFIDATVPHIWLPQDACTLFEDAFGITYNSTVDRYLVNSTLHTQLQSQNASVSFLIGNDVSGGETVTITLPYEAFDLEVGPPIVDTTQYYFPLRRAANSSQYTMGRTFLQEAYLTTNYEYSNFSVAQNVWVEAAPSQIISIASANTTNTSPKIIIHHNKPKPISTGALIGIVLAVVLLLIVAAAGIFFLRRRRKRRRAKGADDTDSAYALHKPELDGVGKGPVGELFTEGKLAESDSSSKIEMQGSDAEISSDKRRAEMEGSKGILASEMEGTKGVLRSEVEGTRGVLRSEMEGTPQNSEMEGSAFGPVEMYAGPHGLYELESLHTDAAEGTDVPSPLGGSRKRRSGIVSWGRRQKPTPSLPHSSSEDISPNTDEPDRHSGAGIWNSRRPRGTPRSITPQDVSSPTSESSRSRMHSRGDLLTQRLEAASRSNHPPEISSPSDSSRERRPRPTLDPAYSNRTTAVSSNGSRERLDSGADAWNQRFGAEPRSLTPDVPSPSPLGRRGREHLGSTTSGEEGISGGSNYHTPGERSPLSPGNFF